ncbi:hypothetical protein GWI33_021031 [Rhynchophorus ferrugineus]|uniref:GH18 domain-containing protein n=1 Tax=Rhynchophorus ferrugineus TaxID=354439 RepID=A0A834HNH4_RHYFE|nr:hypothetical protein GWI33_021031 [Rhynchophorus ferrugineus]
MREKREIDNEDKKKDCGCRKTVESKPSAGCELLNKYNFDGIDFDWQFPEKGDKAFQHVLKEYLNSPPHIGVAYEIVDVTVVASIFLFAELGPLLAVILVICFMICDGFSLILIICDFIFITRSPSLISIVLVPRFLARITISDLCIASKVHPFEFLPGLPLFRICFPEEFWFLPLLTMRGRWHRQSSLFQVPSLVQKASTSVILYL